jgi:hypothetical protein
LLWNNVFGNLRHLDWNFISPRSRGVLDHDRVP